MLIFLAQCQSVRIFSRKRNEINSQLEKSMKKALALFQEDTLLPAVLLRIISARLQKIKGKIIFAETSPYRIYKTAIVKGGALGLITYNNPVTYNLHIICFLIILLFTNQSVYLLYMSVNVWFYTIPALLVFQTERTAELH